MTKITRGDVARVLTEVGPPGQKTDEKVAAVKKLFADKGRSTTGVTGVNVVETLKTYTEF